MRYSVRYGSLVVAVGDARPRLHLGVVAHPSGERGRVASSSAKLRPPSRTHYIAFSRGGGRWGAFGSSYLELVKLVLQVKDGPFQLPAIFVPRLPLRPELPAQGVHILLPLQDEIFLLGDSPNMRHGMKRSENPEQMK